MPDEDGLKSAGKKIMATEDHGSPAGVPACGRRSSGPGRPAERVAAPVMPGHGTFGPVMPSILRVVRAPRSQDEAAAGTVPSALGQIDEGVGGTGHQEATGEATVEVWMLLNGRNGVSIRMERQGMLGMGNALTAACGLVPAARGVSRRSILEGGCRDGRIRLGHVQRLSMVAD
jgi:hypothetical protein